MISARSVTNQAADLAAEQRPRGSTPRSRYSTITVGRDYAVHGMVIWENQLQFLIEDDNSLPRVLPAALFEKVNGPVPGEWWFATFDGLQASGNGRWSSPLIAACGYEELLDPEHLSALVEAEPAAVQLFRDRITGSTEQ